MLGTSLSRRATGTERELDSGGDVTPVSSVPGTPAIGRRDSTPPTGVGSIAGSVGVGAGYYPVSGRASRQSDTAPDRRSPGALGISQALPPGSVSSGTDNVIER